MTAVEVCLDDPAGALLAERAGADRVELCAALEVGGLTPSAGALAAVLRTTGRVGVSVLVRPRAGDATYSDDELDVLLADVEAVRATTATAAAGQRVGVVVGALTRDGRVDAAVLARVVEAAGPLPVTFHRAFDTLADRSTALEVLVDHGVARVLTSGGAPTAAEGVGALAALVEQAAGRLEVMAGGGVRPGSAARLRDLTGVPAVHLRAAAPAPPGVPSATAVSYEVPRSTTSAEVVAAVVAALR